MCREKVRPSMQNSAHCMYHTKIGADCAVIHVQTLVDPNTPSQPCPVTWILPRQSTKPILYKIPHPCFPRPASMALAHHPSSTHPSPPPRKLFWCAQGPLLLPLPHPTLTHIHIPTHLMRYGPLQTGCQPQERPHVKTAGTCHHRLPHNLTAPDRAAADWLPGREWGCQHLRSLSGCHAVGPTTQQQ